LPEVVVKVTLLNFMITQVGLQDQLLNIVVEKELPEMAEEKVRLVIEGAENKKQLENVENKILAVLSSSSGNILDDESAIQILQSSKALSNEVAEKQAVAEETEKAIDIARQGYIPVAFQSSVLFFVVADMGNIDPMYQYSLPFYVGLFLLSIKNSEKADELEDRLKNLNDCFCLTLYNNICRSLFEKHKLLFSFLMFVRLQLAYDGLPMDEYRFLLTGGVSMEDPPPSPADWVPARCWSELFKLHLQGGIFSGCHKKFSAEIEKWRKLYDVVDPLAEMSDDENAPKMCKGMSQFQLVVVLRCFRPDRVIPAIIQLVGGKMGPAFVAPPPFDLPASYGDSMNTTPLVFLLSPGSDPTNALRNFAAEKNKEINSISLGQGQGPKAEAMIDDGKSRGGWVLLNNCHLSVSWMPRLDRICETLEPKSVHRDFRLWLTSYPSKDFPVAILQNGVKMTNEAPKGLRANLQGSFLKEPICTEEFFEGCTQKVIFKRLCTGLLFFHAVIQERRLYGPLGWNGPYEFTENDLRISVMQLNMFLDEYPEELPLKALTYMTGECNYGGRVTDDKDRRLNATLLRQYYNMECAVDTSYRFAPYDEYYAPATEEKDLSHEEHLEYVRQLPPITPPEVFGFNQNAAITKEQGETYQMMSDLLSTVGQSSGGAGANQDEVVGEVANDVTTRVRQTFDVASVQEKYPIKYEESMNTVIGQELTRYNKLLAVIHSSLANIKKAIKGLLLMDEELEAAYNAIFDGKVPPMWIKKSYNTLKPLGSYVNDLVERVKFYETWIAQGIPVVFWFSGIFFTQAFTTGAMQNFARKYTIPIDTLQFDFDIPRDQSPADRPDDGVWTTGLFFEAGRWDYDAWKLEESEPKVLFVPMPLFHLQVKKKADLTDLLFGAGPGEGGRRITGFYNCPCYKVSSRKGVLATTGHSSNFVMYIRIPSDVCEDHWTKRGVALLTQLDV
jgi:dynein heavy chain